jgi:hypothetical protein
MLVAPAPAREVFCGRPALFLFGFLAALPACGVVAEADPAAASGEGKSAFSVPYGDGDSLSAESVAGLVCPAQMALVAVATTSRTVCIDRYEAGVERKRPDGTFEPWPFDRVVDGLTVRAVVAPGRKPQAYISGTQAQAACKLAGKRLCTQDEWLAACQGPSRFTYPYGNTYQKGACNEGRATNPVNDCFGPGGSVFTGKNMNDPCCVNKPNTVAPGGSFSKCVSAYGVYDLHGNLHEWIDATTSSGNGVFRGGFFVDAKINGAGCLYRTVAHAKTYHDYSTGFRCCADPAPAP